MKKRKKYRNHAINPENATKSCTGNVEFAEAIFQVANEGHVVGVAINPAWNEVGGEGDDAAVRQNR